MHLVDYKLFVSEISYIILTLYYPRGLLAPLFKTALVNCIFMHHTGPPGLERTIHTYVHILYVGIMALVAAYYRAKEVATLSKPYHNHAKIDLLLGCLFGFSWCTSEAARADTRESVKQAKAITAFCYELCAIATTI